MRVPRLVMLAVIALAGPAVAEPIRYDITAPSGVVQLGDQLLTGPYAIEIITDTLLANPLASAPAYQAFMFQNSPFLPGSARVTLPGVGTVAITEPLAVIANGSSACDCVGLRDLTAGAPDFLTLIGLGFGGVPYTLRTAIGPLTGSGINWGNVIQLSTTAGDFRFVSSAPATFTATIVPVPAPAALLLGALGVLGGVIRRGDPRCAARASWTSP